MVDPLLLFYKKIILKTQAPEFLLALLSFLFTFIILTIYLGQSDWGEEFVSPYKMSDAALYLHKAWYMAFVNEDGGFLASFIPVSPYVTIQTFAYKLFGPYVVTPFITNIVLLSIASAFLTLLTFNLFDRKSAFFTLFIFAFCGPVIFYSGISSKESSVIFFLCSSLYYFERYVNKHSFLTLIFFFLFFLGLIFERNNFLVFIPLLFFVNIFYEKETCHKYIFSLFVIIIILLLKIISGANEPLVSPVGLNFYIGNSQKSTGTYIRTPKIRDSLIGHYIDSENQVKRAIGHKPDKKEITQYWVDKALTEIQQAPVEYSKLLFKKMAMLFAQHAPGSPEQFSLWRWHKTSLAIALFDYGVILSLAVSGILLSRFYRKRSIDTLFSLIMLIYAATVWVFFINERYRFPLMIMLIPYAAYFIRMIIAHPKDNKIIRYIVLSLGVFCMSFLLNNINPQGPGWVSNEAKVRAKEQRKSQENLRLILLKQAAVLNPDAVKWRELAFYLKRYKLYKDADELLLFSRNLNND